MAAPRRDYWDTNSSALSDRTINGRPIPLPLAGGKGRWAIACWTHKSGSSEWKRALWPALAQRGYTLPLVDQRRLTHAGRLPYDWKPEYERRVAYRWIFVRHPATRVLSAFFGHAVGGPSFQRLDGFHRPYPSRWLLPNHSFADFVRVVVGTPTPALNPHYRRMSDLCGLASGRWYDTVLRYETRWSEHWDRTVARALGIEHAPSRHGSRAEETLDVFYTPALARAVNAWAAEDLHRFGYAPWAPGMRIRDTVV